MLRHWRKVLPVLCLLGALGLAGDGPAAAAQLDGATCDALKAEYDRLNTDALKSDMAKGAEWGKANLDPARLKEIETVIGLEESLTFRCERPRLAMPPVKAPLPVAATPATAQPPQAAPQAGAPAPAGQSAPQAGASAAKPADATKAASAPGTPAAAPQPAAKQPAARKKKTSRKADDAYVPPSPATVVSPPVAAQ